MIKPRASQILGKGYTPQLHAELLLNRGGGGLFVYFMRVVFFSERKTADRKAYGSKVTSCCLKMWPIFIFTLVQHQRNLLSGGGEREKI